MCLFVCSAFFHSLTPTHEHTRSTMSTARVLLLSGDLGGTNCRLELHASEGDTAFAAFAPAFEKVRLHSIQTQDHSYMRACSRSTRAISSLDWLS